MATVYTKAQANFMNGNIDLTDDTIKFALCTSTYTPNQDTHEHFDDITNEVSGSGYTAGGATLANKAITEDAANNRVTFDNTADITFTASGTITARYGIFYKDTGTASTSPLIAYEDFTSDVSATDGDLTFTPHADGILRFTIS